MKCDRRERLVAFALWFLTMHFYTWSFVLPWFDFDPGRASPVPAPGHRFSVFGTISLALTGEEAFFFILERTAGGSFVGLAHPFFWLGWALLAFRRWRGGAICGCLALVCALNAVLLFQPREGPWFPPKSGYYLWFLSMVLLASSSFIRNSLCSDHRTLSREQLEQMAAKQQALASQLDDLKQLTDEAVDLQAANILLEMSARDTGDNDR
jgi:hypothetical protein